MLVTYDIQTEIVTTVDWVSQVIKPFCGKFSPELWEKMKPYCRTQEGKHKHLMPTRTNIWSSNGYLAYCEPINAYLINYELFKTGQGLAGKTFRYAKKCHSCGRDYDC